MDDVIADFVAEAREGLAALDSELVRFEQNPDDPESLGAVFRLIHSIKGACGFLGLGRLQSVTHAAENVLGAFRDGELAVTPDAVTVVLETVDLTGQIIEALAATGAEPEGDDAALIARLEAILAGPAAPLPACDKRPLIDRLGGEATVDAACEMVVCAQGGVLAAAADPDRLQGALRDGLVGVARGKRSGGDLAAAVAAVVGPDRGAVSALVDGAVRNLLLLEAPPGAVAELGAKAQDGLDAVRAAPTPKPAPAQEPPAPPATVSGASEPTPDGAGPQTIRVGVSALEHLMTVASELVLIRNQLLQLLRDDPESPFAAPLHRLNQVTSELQEGVMTARMQPIGGAWAKLPRVVRDLARDLGKRIELVLEGQDTELDRQVLELIKDPLTHMIRNAADHGLETSAERRQAGKPETGRIQLSARHEGGAIVIEMADDGRGLPLERIRAKAVGAGLITAQQAETLSEAEARRLIFLPGFSTAAEVTAVSGRGVGMDVVRTNIEKIGGSIEVASTEGAGTRFTIRIPLTLSIVSALIVECCGERFAMPQSSVVELVSANDASGRTIEYIGETAVLRLRDRLLPLVSLQELLKLPPERANTAETCILVAQVGASLFGVIVDRVFDTEEIVVKPVASILRHLRLFSGATILGDGAVIMILDAKGIAGEAGCEQAEAACAALNAEAAAEGLPTVSILTFRTPEGAVKAVPLANVARIEEVDGAAIEQVGGRSVLQYRGRLMPVVGADMAPVRTAQSGLSPLLVFAQDDLSAGLLTGEIIDIVEGAIGPDLTPVGPGSLGSLILAERATELIDADAFWRAALQMEPVQRTAPAAVTPALPAVKRLLLIDRSPFCQLLLRPLLAQAGYEITVAGDPSAALALHDAGERFDLILADTSQRGDAARALAQAFDRASAWHATPLLGLGLQTAGGFDGDALLSAVSDSLGEREQLRGAA